MWKKKKQFFFLEKYPKHKKKFEECLKLNSWNGFFVSPLNLGFNIFSVWTTIQYLAYEQQFKTWDKLLFTLTRDTLPKSDLYTSGTRKKNADFTEPVFCPFCNHWINFWIVVQVFRAQLGLICVRQIQVWPYLSVDEQCEFLDRMDFDAIFQQINLRYQWAIWVYAPEI